MSLLGTIAGRAAEQNMAFLLAGGHAVIAHGYPRNTFDIDLIIRRSDRDAWSGLARGLGYSIHHEGPAFLQFNPANPEMLPLDLMLVNDESFAKLQAEAVAAPASAGTAKIVSLRHLLALKCHAIKHGHPGRIVKDADDVISLVQANRLDVNQPELRELLLITESWTCMKNSNDSALKAESGDLEFPDWSGMDDASTRVTADAAFHFCEQYRAMFPDVGGKWQAQRQEKSPVEFVL